MRRIHTVACVNCRRCGDGVPINFASKHSGYCEPCAVYQESAHVHRDDAGLDQQAAYVAMPDAA